MKYNYSYQLHTVRIFGFVERNNKYQTQTLTSNDQAEKLHDRHHFIDSVLHSWHKRVDNSHKIREAGMKMGSLYLSRVCQR